MEKIEKEIGFALEGIKKKPVFEKTKGTKLDTQQINRYKYDLEITKTGFELSKTRSKDILKKPKCAKPFIISVLPTIFQPLFKNIFSKAFPQYSGNEKGSIIQTGCMQEDNIFYKRIEKLQSIELLPDILITSDFNCLYHRNFTRKFLNDENFEASTIPMHSIFSNSIYTPANKLFGILAADALVMVVNKSKFVSSKSPREWYELLNPDLLNSLILCGNKDFFSNTFYYHYIKTYGFEAINQLARNTKMHMHPEEMLDSLHSDIEMNASVYVMPYSYAQKLQNKFEYAIIWPNDGAMLLPIQMLIKKGACEKHSDIINFLTGKELGNELEKYGFLATNPDTSKKYPGNTLNWIGWDFIEKNDIGKMKIKIRALLSEKEQ